MKKHNRKVAQALGLFVLCCIAAPSLGVAQEKLAQPASETMIPYVTGRTLYENALAKPDDVQAFRMEGNASVTFPSGRMRIENLGDASEGQKANIVFWCPTDFPADIEVSWDFRPIREPGLAILFFGATGRNGEDIFDPKLKPRNGPYPQYHSSDLNALHVSYFRRRYPQERAFHLCNLRKSYGFHLVAQGADPIPSVEDAAGPYRIRINKWRGEVRFFINDLPIFHWRDDGKTHGPLIGGGKIGFRQMAPLIADYANLRVSELVAAPPQAIPAP